MTAIRVSKIALIAAIALLRCWLVFAPSRAVFSLFKVAWKSLPICWYPFRAMLRIAASGRIHIRVAVHLPHRPQAIDVAVMQIEERIKRRVRRKGHLS